MADNTLRRMFFLWPLSTSLGILALNPGVEMLAGLGR